MERRDKRGRRIGRNWWREYNCDLLLDADLVWCAKREEVALGYKTEMIEFAYYNPRPTLKEFLIRNKGMNTEPQ